MTSDAYQKFEEKNIQLTQKICLKINKNNIQLYGFITYRKLYDFRCIHYYLPLLRRQLFRYLKNIMYKLFHLGFLTIILYHFIQIITQHYLIKYFILKKYQKTLAKILRG